MHCGIYLKPKAGGIICYYSPKLVIPSFWYFKPGDSLKYISKKFIERTSTDYPIKVHINQTSIKDIRQSHLQSELNGMFSAYQSIIPLEYKTVDLPKCKARIMHLLDIRTKKEFHKKLISKGMHNNQYNSVWKITSNMSKQAITSYRNAYMLAYYGYLKDVIKEYNNGDKNNTAKINDSNQEINREYIV